MRILVLAIFLVGCGNLDKAKVEADKNAPAQEGLESGPNDTGFDISEATTPDDVAAFTVNSGLPAFFLEKIVYAGNGCRQGTVGTSIAEDRQAFTMIFDDFAAVVEMDDRQRAQQRRCFVRLHFNAQPGWSFGLLTTQARGFVALDAGARASQIIAVRTQGNSYRVLNHKRFKGAASDDYLSEQKLAFRNIPWSPCRGSQKSLTILTQLDVKAPRGAAALITTDSLDGAIAQDFRLVWRRCR